MCRNAGVELEGITTVAAGLTGLGEVWSRRSELCDQLYTHLALAEVVVASDVVTSHLGALAGMPGVVAAIGTGSVVLGLDGGGRAVKVDGWGHLLGDAGSGFAIGRSGLRAALEHHDGRGGSARLASAAEARFGPLEELSGAILADPARVRRVASFAPDVADAARAGDALASRIWADAATSVAAAILAAMRRLGPGEASRTVSWAGSLLEVEDLMRSPVRQRVTAEVGDDVDWSAPAGTAIDGAAALLWSEVRARAGDLVHRATWTD
ncbi:MAG: hypothetical protein JJT89_06250 [Nitriliruptoraceae bacterium]|nr:hypothetical protein [Nitriliruptoraceae bacterium]